MAEKKVSYTATADFSALSKELTRLRRKIKELRQEEQKLAATSKAAAASRTASSAASSKAVEKESDKLDEAARSAEKHAAASTVDAVATRRAAAAHDDLADSASKSEISVGNSADNNAKNTRSINPLTSALHGLASAFSRVFSAARGGGSGGSGGSGGAGAPGGGDAKGNLLKAGSWALAGKAVLDFGKKLNATALGVGKMAGMITVIGAAIGPAISALGTLGTAALAAGSSLSSLGGIVLGLPGIFAAAATGIASVVTAISGVSDVFTAYGAQQKAISTATNQTVSQQQQAARQVVATRRALAAARLAEDRLVVDSQRAVEDADRRVEDSIQGVKDAQEALTQARKDARAELDKLNDSLDSAKQKEKDVAKELADARKDLATTLGDPAATAAEREAAQKRVQRAEETLTNAQRASERAEKSRNAEKRKGIEGDKDVIDAKQGVKDAETEAQRAQEDYTRAVQDAAIAQKDAAIATKDAAIALKDAQATQRGETEAVTQATDEYEAALKKLSPSARKVVTGLIGLEGQWKKLKKNVQEDFFSELTGSVKDLGGFLPTLENLLGKSAGAMGRLAANAIKVITSGPFEKDFGTIADQNAKLIDTLSKALGPILNVLKDITIAAGPFVQAMADSLVKGARSLADLVEAGRDSGRLADWLETVWKRLKLVWDIVKNVGDALFNLGKATSGYGDTLLGRLKKMTKGWADVAEAQTKAGSPLKKFLRDADPLLRSMTGLLGDVWDALLKLASNKKFMDNATKFFNTLAKDLLPIVVDLLEQFGEGKTLERVTKLVETMLGIFRDFVEAGGFDSIDVFLDTLNSILTTLAPAIQGLAESGAFKIIATGLGAIAAIKFVSTITGLGAIFGFLTKIAGIKMGKNALQNMFGGIPGYQKKGGFFSKIKGFFGGGKGKDVDLPGSSVGTMNVKAGVVNVSGGGKTPGGKGGGTTIIPGGGGPDGKAPTKAEKDALKEARKSGGWLKRISGFLGRGLKGVIATALAFVGLDGVVAAIAGAVAGFAGITTTALAGIVAPIALIGAALVPLTNWIQDRWGGGQEGTDARDKHFREDSNLGVGAERGQGMQGSPVDTTPGGRSTGSGGGTNRGNQTAGGRAADARHNAAEQAAAVREAQEAQDRLNASIRDYSTALKESNQQSKKSEDGIKGNSDAVIQNKAALFRQATAAQLVRQRMEEVGASTEELDGQQRKAAIQFVKTAKKMGATQKQAEKLAAGYGLIPPGVKTHVWLTGAEQAVKDAREVARRVKESLQTVVDVAVPDWFGSTPPKKTKTPRRAAGGIVPGAGDADTTPILATPGEWVIKKRSSQILSPYMSAINSRPETVLSMFRLAQGGPNLPTQRLPRFAAGGQVTTTTANNTNRNRGVVVQQLTINNPRPEMASESLPRSIRKLAYLGVS